MPSLSEMLTPGSVLDIGNMIQSANPNPEYALEFMPDGDIQVWQYPNALTTDPSGPDGNGTLVWALGSGGMGGTVLYMDPDGNLSLWAPGDVCIWDTLTYGRSGNGVYLFVQGGYNYPHLALYDPTADEYLWYPC